MVLKLVTRMIMYFSIPFNLFRMPNQPCNRLKLHPIIGLSSMLAYLCHLAPFKDWNWNSNCKCGMLHTIVRWYSGNLLNDRKKTQVFVCLINNSGIKAALDYYKGKVRSGSFNYDYNIVVIIELKKNGYAEYNGVAYWEIVVSQKVSHTKQHVDFTINMIMIYFFFPQDISFWTISKHVE